MTENKMLKNGIWTDAVEVPYYPSIKEKIGHFFGRHYFYENKYCLLCKKAKKEIEG